MHQLVYLDGAPGGPWMGHALAEVGCIWLGPNQGQVISQAPGAIARFYEWLAKHGERRLSQGRAGGVGARVRAGAGPNAARPNGAGPDGGRPDESRVPLVMARDVRAQVVEIQEIPGFGQSGAAVGFFSPDMKPVTDEDIATAVRRLGYARRDLLDVVGRLPQPALDWQPPGGKRTIRQNLVHLHNCHAFYLSRVLGREGTEAVLPEPWPQDTLTCLEWVRERMTAALPELPSNLRSGVFRAEEPAEQWTARKMLRRFVEHELEHLEVVGRTVEAWRNRKWRDLAQPEVEGPRKETTPPSGIP